MALTLTETRDRMYTSTWQLRIKEVTDQLFESVPIWYLLNKQGHIKRYSGGRFIELPTNYKANSTVKAIGKGGTVSLDDDDPLTTAYYQWRYVVGNVTRYKVDEQQNSGKQKFLDIMTNKLSNLKDSMIDHFETRLCTAQSGMEINGLPTVVQDDPTSDESVGGINQSSYSMWRNQYRDMTGVSFSTNAHDWMVNMFNRCSKGGQGVKRFPTVVVTDQTTHERYEAEVFELMQARIDDPKLRDIGMGDLSFKGRPMVWSPSAPSQKMYFLNLNLMWLFYDPAMWFSMTEWKSIPNQLDRVAQSMCACNLCVSGRRDHGVIFNIDTA